VHPLAQALVGSIEFFLNDAINKALLTVAVVCAERLMLISEQRENNAATSRGINRRFGHEPVYVLIHVKAAACERRIFVKHWRPPYTSHDACAFRSTRTALLQSSQRGQHATTMA
jgi:hypothetical protein